MRISMDLEETGEFSGALLFLEKLETSKVSKNTIGDCICDGIWANSRAGLQRVVLLGTEDARFGLAAAEGPWMGLSGLKTARNWFGEAVRVQYLGKYWSNKVWEQLQCWSAPQCGFWVDLSVFSMRGPGAHYGSRSSFGRRMKGLKRS